MIDDALVKYRCHPKGISKNVPALFSAQEVVLDTILPEVNRSAGRRARGRSAAIAGWLALSSGDFTLASHMYSRAIRHEPRRLSHLKGFLKSLIRFG